MGAGYSLVVSEVVVLLDEVVLSEAGAESSVVAKKRVFYNEAGSCISGSLSKCSFNYAITSSDVMLVLAYLFNSSSGKYCSIASVMQSYPANLQIPRLQH